MFWDDLVRRWRREHGGLEPRTLRAAAGHVAVLPERPPRRRSRWPLYLLLVLGALLLLARAGDLGPLVRLLVPAG